MTKITTLDLTPLYRNAIGVDRLFDRLMSQIDATGNTQNYPPYNIIKTDENKFEVQVAVAGFNQGDIDVSMREGNLVITGDQVPRENTEHYEYIHHGISARKFIRTFQLADYVEVVSAEVNNGILSVCLERKVPEALQPKSIAITYKN